MKIEGKAAHFLIALSDVYKDDEKRRLYTLGRLDINPKDVTDDFTAMLVAMKALYERITGDKESDLIDFTNILNKLAFQYIMDGRDENAAD